MGYIRSREAGKPFHGGDIGGDTGMVGKDLPKGRTGKTRSMHSEQGSWLEYVSLLEGQRGLLNLEKIRYGPGGELGPALVMHTGEKLVRMPRIPEAPGLRVVK